MTPTPHTDLKPGDVVLAEVGWLKSDWSVLVVVKVTAKRVTANQMFGYMTGGRHLSTDCAFYRVGMGAANAQYALRHLIKLHNDALRTLNQQHTDRIMKMVRDNQ